ncbi:hypothetical protein F7725_010469 [Dissostichus mawsoni]|uniref:Ig-like domain-containing protein n=1 Tax=Dissostichus mawsoni TaxID=36200 RepID=A0A7J5XP06_DISMA|nr:hypothetical protein F7725_010469 [Dissostichus mawsoni]
MSWALFYLALDIIDVHHMFVISNPSGLRTGLRSFGDLQTGDVFLLLPSLVSAISAIVIAILIHTIKRNKCDYCHNKAAVSLQENVAKRNVKVRQTLQKAYNATRSGCTHDQILETKTVGVGDDVTLTCSRQQSLNNTLFWIRHGPGNFPEVLGGTYSFDYDGVNKTPRITAKQGPGTFLLQISKTEPSDTGVYYCLKISEMKYSNRRFHLSLKTYTLSIYLYFPGPEPDITAIIQGHQSDPVLPGDSVTLQCAVLSESQSKTCPGETRVYWFRAGS